MNPNDNYFNGMYQKIWKSMIPDQLSEKETNFMIEYFQLSKSSHVLDLMAGYGRHSLGLARSGISMHAVDNLKAYTDEIALQASEESLPVEVTNADITSFISAKQVDLAICMGNSLNFFAETHLQIILKNLSKSVVPGGYFLINTWSLIEIAIKEFTSRGWTEIDGIKFLASSHFKFRPARVETQTIMISSEMVIEEKTAIDYLYSISDFERMLDQASFSLEKVYSVPGKKEFSLGDPRAYLVARRR